MNDFNRFNYLITSKCLNHPWNAYHLLLHCSQRQVIQIFELSRKRKTALWGTLGRKLLGDVNVTILISFTLHKMIVYPAVKVISCVLLLDIASNCQWLQATLTLLRMNIILLQVSKCFTKEKDNRFRTCLSCWSSWFYSATKSIPSH